MNSTMLNWFVTKRAVFNYKLGQVLQSEATFLKSGVATTKWGKHSYKKRLLHFNTKMGKSYDRVGQVIHYKVGQLLLQSGTDTTKLAKFIRKWGNYFKVGQYTFVAVGRMENHVY